jgi:hypothetical protein
MTETDALAQLIIRLAALIVWELKDAERADAVQQQGEMIWQMIKEGR